MFLDLTVSPITLRLRAIRLNDLVGDCSDDISAPVLACGERCFYGGRTPRLSLISEPLPDPAAGELFPDDFEAPAVRAVGLWTGR